MGETDTTPAGRSAQLVAALARIAMEATEFEDALRAALAAICDATGWPAGHIVVARRGQLVGTTIWHGADAPAVRAFRSSGNTLRVHAGEGIPGRALAAGHAVWTQDIEQDATFLRRTEALEAGIRRALGVPLTARGDVIGVLELFGPEPAPPDDDVLALLAAVVPEVGLMVDRIQASERLRANEQRYRLLFEGASDAILLGGTDGVLDAVNPAACRLLGYTESELLGMNARNLCAPEWVDHVAHRVARKLEGHEETASYEMVLVDRAGARIPVEVRSTVLRDGEDVIGIHAILRDIRDRKRAEIALRESEERFRAAFEESPVGTALSSLDGRWLKANKTLCTMLGYSEAELLTMRWQDVTHPADLAADLELSTALLAGEMQSYELEKRFVHKRGHTVPVRLCVSLVRGADGMPAYGVAQILELNTPSSAPAAPVASCPLTPRERQVLSLLAEGMRTSEAAARLGIGDETVQTHVRRAMKRLSARSRTHAVSKAQRLGWLEAPPDTTADATSW